MKSNAELKRRRVLGALEHKPADRVPVGEFFWSNFASEAARVAGASDFDPYRFWDLDLVVVTPNMDPRIEGVTVLEHTDGRTVVRTGFGAVIELRRHCPMPRFLSFEAKTFSDLEAFVFDPPEDPRRYTHRINDQLNSVVDRLICNYPSFVDRVKCYQEDFCLFGSVCEPWEYVWRMVGSRTALLMSAEDPLRFARCLERIGDFLLNVARNQITYAGGALSGLYIWGDVAYDRGMFFAPSWWRQALKEQVRGLCEVPHRHNLRAIYHGCGDARAIFDDLREAGVDAYNPLEAKAGLDVVALKRKYGSQWSFNGNIDIRVLESNDSATLRAEVLRKLNAAKGGGYILQSDHSISQKVRPETYSEMIALVRRCGTYPLSLGEYDEPIETTAPYSE